MNKDNSVIKAGKALLPYFLTPAMLVYLIWASAEYKTESKHKQFDTPEQKLQHIIHVDNSINEVEHYKSIQTLDSILFQQRQYQKQTDKRRRKNDSLDLLDKATIFQIKEELKEINSKIND